MKIVSEQKEILETVRIQYQSAEEYANDKALRKAAGWIEIGLMSTSYPWITWERRTDKDDGERYDELLDEMTEHWDDEEDDEDVY